MLKLEKTLRAYNEADFKAVAQQEITALEADLLPLQQALSQSSYVSKTPFSITILNVTDNNADINIKAGVFFTGIIAGCNCSDDPSPVDELNEYCNLLFTINKSSAETSVRLLEE